MPRGGPDGGDGGRGGSVILEATHDVSDLSLYKSRKKWHAVDGADGAGGRKTGRTGADIRLKVPVGTVALDGDGALIADLDTNAATAIVARGGLGGRGNVHFKSSTRRAPDYAEPGLKGEELAVTLDLKLIADVGLVGPPNAGKSSLLRAMTAARPKVAAYPFTTLDPQLGVADSGAGRIVIADIPGLIEGAAQGAGLGQRFLRHVERTRALVYLLDGASPDPWRVLDSVKAEVGAFSADLLKRPSLVVVNKVDLPGVRKLRSRSKAREVRFVSALTGEGVEDLSKDIARLVASAPVPPTLATPRVTRLAERPRPDLVVERVPAGYVVRGERVELLVEQTNLDSETGLGRFQGQLDRLGVSAALEAAGVQPGDTVRIGGVEFEYQP